MLASVRPLPGLPGKDLPPPASAAGEGRADFAPAGEEAPLGIAEYHADPPDHVCGVCHAQLMVERHRADCPERARIYRMDVVNDAAMARAEAALQRATDWAFALWLLSGRTL